MTEREISVYAIVRCGGRQEKASVDDVRRAFRIAKQYKSKLTRHDRYRILMKAGDLIAAKKDEIARLITLESGLCIKDTLYEVGRKGDNSLRMIMNRTRGLRLKS